MKQFWLRLTNAYDEWLLQQFLSTLRAKISDDTTVEKDEWGYYVVTSKSHPSWVGRSKDWFEASIEFVRYSRPGFLL
ncbi:MAG: hypothetical protein AB1861_08370 [Cyanobacteriota bacterium]